MFRYGEFLQCSCLDRFTFGKLHGNTPYSAVLPECCRRNNHLNHQSGLSIPRPSYKSCLQDMCFPVQVFPSLLSRGLACQQLWKPCHNKSVHLKGVIHQHLCQCAFYFLPHQTQYIPVRRMERYQSAHLYFF